MLAHSGIISADDLAEIERGLTQVRQEVDEDRFDIKPDDEDVHMAIERRLTELVGDPGRRLHTARSRNDQVATDVAMLVRAHSLTARDQLTTLMGTLVDLAERHLDWPMPGYTHLQHAQPVYLAHHLLAYFWKFRRDLQRFGGIAENSLDAVSNRDFVLDYLSAAATCATHLSQLGAEIVLWSSEEFGFCQVADVFASGSSLMPPKKNPDAAELLRAKAPRVAGRLVTLHGVLHGLPLAYNKDLQEDKEQLFDAIDTVELCLAVADGMLQTISFDRERLAAGASDELLAATDVADLLVKRGVAFREAHGVVGGLVRAAVDRGKRLSELTEAELADLAPQLDSSYYELLRDGAWLESKVSEGGTSSARVKDQLSQARHILAELAEPAQP